MIQQKPRCHFRLGRSMQGHCKSTDHCKHYKVMFVTIHTYGFVKLKRTRRRRTKTVKSQIGHREQYRSGRYPTMNKDVGTEQRLDNMAAQTDRDKS